MKIITLIIIFCSFLQNGMSQNQSNNGSQIRSFINFLYDFRNCNSSFHKSHITFPIDYSSTQGNNLIYENAYSDSIKNDKSVLSSITGFFLFTSENNSVSFIKDTDKRLLYEIDSSGLTEYYFNKSDDNWTLFKIMVNNSPNGSNIESFENFIYKFLKYESFRDERTIFPLRFIRSDVMENIDTSYINKSEVHFYLNHFIKVFIVYDNFEKIRPNLEKAYLTWTGNDNGVLYGYDFTFINGKWFLESEWDGSN